MQAILAFLGANAGYVSIGALMLSVFCAGSMLKGEQVRKEEIREQLRDIEAQTASTMERVHQITAQLEAQDRQLVQEIEKTYGELAALSAEETEARRAKASADQQIRQATRRPAGYQAIQDIPGFHIRGN
ncbi:MAG: hypothetical protein R2834_00765 [Rhodothermales bacterium]